jgi:fatty-acyl-CoA synthase
LNRAGCGEKYPVKNVGDPAQLIGIATVGGLLQRRAAESGDRTAVIWAARNLQQTYAELYDDALKVAQALGAYGLGPGEHAAVWAPNVPEYLTVEFGCALAGVPILFINSGYRAYELEYVLRQSDTRILFLADGNLQPGEYVDIVREVRTRLPDLCHSVVFGKNVGEGFTAWPEFLARGDGFENTALVRGDDIFSIQYTSGTTGQPKAALLSHQAYVTNSFAIAERQGLTDVDVVCVPLPLFHAYGCLTLFSALAAGATVVVVERFRASDLLAAIERYGGTMLSGTPTMFVAALAELETHLYDLSSLRGGNVAGAFCPPELARQVIERMQASEFGILYGSTEGLVSLMNRPDAPLPDRTGTVGVPMPGFDVQIIDPQTGETLPPGQQGELLLRGPGLMQGYYRLPEATVRTIDEQGWLHSGDLGVIDAAGRCRITGRIKDLIIRGGENVFPAEIEQFLLTHPKVRDAQVVGVPCDYYGEDIVAFIRLKTGEAATALELKQYCRAHIAIGRVPALFFFVDEYPLTASGKIQKFRLQEMARQKMSEL